MKKIVLYGSFTENMLKALSCKCPEGFNICHVHDSDDLSELSSADYIINRGAAVDEKVINAAERVKLIQKWGVGYDKIDVKLAGTRGVPVAICVGGNSLPVAELTVSLMLNVLRNVVPMAMRMKKGEWAREQFSGRSYLLHGKTIGLVGIGNVAKKVAAIVRNGFECEVLYYDIFRLNSEDEERLGAHYVPLEDLMSRSDIVSLHVPLLESTAGMINRSMLLKMKPSACLINTSRGGVVNEQDLIQILKEGKILGAALDTFAVEPLSENSELLKLENVVTTPHCAGNTVDNDINMAGICMDCIARYDSSGSRDMREIVNKNFLL